LFLLSGSWHDARVAEPIFELLKNDARVPPPYRMLADVGFKMKQLQPHKLIVPRSKDQWSNNRRLRAEQKEAQACVVRARQAVEWGNRALQGSFTRLRGRLPASKSQRKVILLLACLLYNVRVRCVGLNQIRTVYLEPLQVEREEGDRVAQFYGVDDDE
jgi:hypothetical protein